MSKFLSSRTLLMFCPYGGFHQHIEWGFINRGHDQFGCQYLLLLQLPLFPLHLRVGGWSLEPHPHADSNPPSIPSIGLGGE